LPRTEGRIDRDECALLVVDVQANLAPHILDDAALRARIAALIQGAKRFRIPRVATEHCADQIGPLVNELRGEFEPGEIFGKTCFGATDHREFLGRLARMQRRQVVVAGMEAHVCVMQTSLGLAAHDYEVFVVADAVGSRAERQQDRDLALERLRKAGCTLVGTETVLFEWTRAGNDAAFRDVLRLVKSLPRN
jgi:nicotinamidase-related amidase